MIRTRLLRAGAVLGLLAGTCLSAPAAAAIFTVTSDDDSGSGSLREAMTAALALPGGAHAIAFALPVGSVIALDQPLPTLGGIDLSIDGSAVPGLAIDADDSLRPIVLGMNVDLRLRHLEVRNGRSTNAPGGCVWSDDSSSTLTFEGVTFSGCRTRGSVPARGGAVYSRGPMFVYDSRFIGNAASSIENTATGGAISVAGAAWIEDSLFEANTAVAITGGAAGGAISAGSGTLTVLRSRFIGNGAEREGVPEQSSGGAIYVRNDSSATLRQSLFFDNAAGDGSAVYAGPYSTGESMAVIVSNTTFAGNRGGPALLMWDGRIDLKNNSFWKNAARPQTSAHLLVHGQRTAVDAAAHNLVAETVGGAPACHSYDLPAGLLGTGANLFTDTSCGFIDTFSLTVPGDLRIRALRATGSGLHDIPVVDLFAGSPAIDAGNPDTPGSGTPYVCTAGDARDEDRPADGDGDGTAVCDIGALELQHEASLFADDHEPVLLR